MPDSSSIEVLKNLLRAFTFLMVLSFNSGMSMYGMH